MPRLQLRVYRDPGQAEVFLNNKLKDGGFGGILERTTLHLDMPNLTGYLQM